MTWLSFAIVFLIKLHLAQSVLASSGLPSRHWKRARNSVPAEARAKWVNRVRSVRFANCTGSVQQVVLHYYYHFFVLTLGKIR